MITKIVLKDGTELKNVADVSEQYTKRLGESSEIILRINFTSSKSLEVLVDEITEESTNVIAIHRQMDGREEVETISGYCNIMSISKSYVNNQIFIDLKGGN